MTSLSGFVKKAKSTGPDCKERQKIGVGVDAYRKEFTAGSASQEYSRALQADRQASDRRLAYD